MKQKKSSDVRPANDCLPIPHNRVVPPMSSAVREFAELLAEIAIRQLRSQQNVTQGDHPHV